MDFWVVKLAPDNFTSTVNFNLESSNLSPYPNPTKNILSFKNPQSEISDLKIYNTLGEEISFAKNQITKTKNETHVSLSSLPSSIYLLKVIDKKGNVFAKKFIKK
jgi:hypothetical protein